MNVSLDMYARSIWKLQKALRYGIYKIENAGNKLSAQPTESVEEIWNRGKIVYEIEGLVEFILNLYSSASFF